MRFLRVTLGPREATNPPSASCSTGTVTWTLLQPEQGSVSRLDALPGWRRVYTDAEAMIHMRVAAPPGS
jgi:hypothetical protein